MLAGPEQTERLQYRRCARPNGETVSVAIVRISGECRLNGRTDTTVSGWPGLTATDDTNALRCTFLPPGRTTSSGTQVRPVEVTGDELSRCLFENG